VVILLFEHHDSEDIRAGSARSPTAFESASMLYFLLQKPAETSHHAMDLSSDAPCMCSDSWYCGSRVTHTCSARVAGIAVNNKYLLAVHIEFDLAVLAARQYYLGLGERLRATCGCRPARRGSRGPSAHGAAANQYWQTVDDIRPATALNGT
jgi:hypothetical protein